MIPTHHLEWCVDTVNMGYGIYYLYMYSLIIFADDCGDGDIRLVNGESEIEGRVEICRGRRWGTMCDSQWTDNHTAVVCRYLGFSDIIGGRVERPNIQYTDDKLYCPPHFRVNLF